MRRDESGAADVPTWDPTYQILFIHTIDVWADDREVLDSLRWWSIGNIDGHFDIVADSAWFGLKWAGQRGFWKLELERERMLATRQNRNGFPFLCGMQNQSFGHGHPMYQNIQTKRHQLIFREKQLWSTVDFEKREQRIQLCLNYSILSVFFSKILKILLKSVRMMFKHLQFNHVLIQLELMFKKGWCSYGISFLPSEKWIWKTEMFSRLLDW